MCDNMNPNYDGIDLLAEAIYDAGREKLLATMICIDETHIDAGPEAMPCAGCIHRAAFYLVELAKLVAPLERPRPAPPESRSPYDGMVDFTPEQALRWALDYIADGSDETPPHVCEFDSDPTTGACDFHERYWAARESLDWLARGGSAGTGAAPPDPIQDAIQLVEMYRGDFTHHGCTDVGVERCSYCPAAPVENDNRCVRCKKADALLERLRGGAAQPPRAPR